MLRNVLFKLKSRVFKISVIPKPKCQTDKLAPKLNKKGNLSRQDREQVYSSHEIRFSSLDLHNIFKLNRFENMELLSVLRPPECVRGMTTLDKSKFETVVKVPAVSIPLRLIKQVIKHLKPYQLKITKVSPVVDLEKTDPKSSSHKLLLLNSNNLQSYADLPDKIKTDLSLLGIKENDFLITDLKLTYENWSFQEVMQAVMPSDVDGVSGFTEVGHIAHFNLRDQALPFKHIIGDVLLDKIPNVKTVVNKANTIDNTYRTFQMELLAGEDNYVTQTKENGFTYELDFSKVYWNTRLGTEHHRMIKDLTSSDFLFDVFAGIGPFAVPAAKKMVTVFANDLNPYSYESLLKNIKLNKCDTSCIHCSNMDGREFIQTVMKQELTDILTAQDSYRGAHVENITGISVLMNLPALAYTFLDAFNGLLADIKTFNKQVPVPIVHCYCFTNVAEATEKFKGDMDQEIKHRLASVLKHIEVKEIAVRFVRNVAPQKNMMCASFRLTPEILLCKNSEKRTQSSAEDGPPSKCQKTDANRKEEDL